MEQIPLGFSDLAFRPGGHVAYPCQDEAERYDRLVDFISTGLRNREKCIVAVSEYAASFLTDGLLSRSGCADGIPGDQLAILTAAQLLRAPLPKSVQTTVDMLCQAIESSFDGGWRGIRVCTGFTHLYHYEQAIPHLLTAESKMNDLIRDKPITMLCTFAANRLHPRLLDATLQCHPVITDGRSLVRNDSYSEPGQLAESLPKILRELRAAGALVPRFALLDFCGDIPVIRTGDEMDVYTAPQFKELADWIISLSHRELVVDLSDTAFIDVASITELVRIAQILESRRGRLSICDPIEPPRKVFRLVNLHERIPIRPRLEEAIQAARLA